MRACSNCGAPLDNDALFCTECGTKVGTPQRQCPNCGAAIDNDSQFCTECGAKLENVQTVSPESLDNAQNVTGPVNNQNTGTRSSMDNISSAPQQNNKSLLYILGVILAVLVLTIGGNFAYKSYINKQSDDYAANQYPQDISNTYDNTSDSEYNYESEESNSYNTDSENAVEENVEEQQDENESSDAQNESYQDTEQESEIEQNAVAEVVAEKPVVQQPTRKYPSVEVRQGGLISARLSDVSYSNGQVKVHIVVSTSMVRRQFTVTGASARDGNDQYVSVSNVEIVGLSKERGRDYYIITNSDIAYLTAVIPQMPASGSLNYVRVDMSLSGASQWVIIKDISW